MSKVLHINFDVYQDKTVDYKVGGVPCAIQNIIKYLPSGNSHKILSFDSSIDTPDFKNGNFIFPNLDKTHFSKFIRKPLSVFRAFNKVDIFVFHHPPPHKILFYLKILFPFKKFFCFIYTKQFQYNSLMFPVDNFVTTDSILKNNLIESGYPKNKVKKVGVIPDIDKYDIEKNNLNLSLLKDKPTIWYSAGPRYEMGYYVFIDEVIKDVNKQNNYRITLLGEMGVDIDTRLLKMSNVEFASMYSSVPDAMSQIDIMAYLIIDHVHKMHMPLMLIEAMLMKRTIISTLSGGTTDVLNDKNCIIVNKRGGFLDVISKFSKQDLINKSEMGYKDVKSYIDRTLVSMEELFNV
jgi:hypothetical protein